MLRDRHHSFLSQRLKIQRSGECRILFVGEAQAEQRDVWIECQRVVQAIFDTQVRQGWRDAIRSTGAELAARAFLQWAVITGRIAQEFAGSKNLEADRSDAVLFSEREN